VDRAALAALGRANAPQPATFAEPRTQIERQLAEIWGELLGIERVDVNDRFLVSIHDHFFDLGGTSLSALKLVIATGRAVTFKDLTKHPSLADLAALLDQRGVAVPISNGSAHAHCGT
jgi:hypothetical protein